MQTIYLYLIPAILLIGIVIFLWAVLVRSQKKQTVNIRDASLSSEGLEEHAKAISMQHAVTSQRYRIVLPISRMNNNYDYILSTYQILNQNIQKKSPVPQVAEWLLDNFYMIEEQVMVLRKNFTRKGYLRLPVLKSGELKGYARIYAIATELISHSDGQIDDPTLIGYLQAYQTHNTLLNREIGAIPMVMMLAIIEYIRHLCEGIEETFIQWNQANQIVDGWIENEGKDTDGIERLIAKHLNTLDELNPTFIEHLFYRLRHSGRSYVNVLRIVDEQLEKFGTDTSTITQKEHNAQSMNTVSMGNCITSIQFIATLNGVRLFDSISHIEQILVKDPDGTYPLMDEATRSHYCSQVEELALALQVSELHIAKEALALAQAADDSYVSNDQAEQERCVRHVGFYLIGKGLPMLIARQKGLKKPLWRYAGLPKHRLGLLYFFSIGMMTFLLSSIAIQYAAMAASSHVMILCIVAGLCVLAPAMEIAVNVVNWVVSKALKPKTFPRLALKDGIPESMGTIVAVPTILPDIKRTMDIVSNLEGQYLRNREPNLFFAIIGSFKDCADKNDPEDASIIQAAMNAIATLNQKYTDGGHDIFYLFHRARQFNQKNNQWISWERKRGALMEFNAFVSGLGENKFAFTSCTECPFSGIRYIIALDSDTILPMGMAKKMISTMAHPLNKPLIDTQKGIVVEGYGLMQPRIDVSSESSNKTFFARVFAGHEGLDPYTNAVSDVYQDLFDEGIFTGKGIYDLKVFQTVLENAIPDNTILSHDLLEGSYVRTGLVTDLQLIDSYPSHYNSFSVRLHRWVRGDWQLLPLLFNKVRARNHVRIKNPLTALSQWKMLDNMRRSLLAPSLMVLAVLAFSGLPGNLFFWLIYLLGSLAVPFIITLIQTLLAQRFAVGRAKRYIHTMLGLKAALFRFLITFVMLPYQAFLMGNAILVTLSRVLVTHRNMLEWIPSADVEKMQKSTLRSYCAQMWIPTLGCMCIPILTVVFMPEALGLGLSFALLWSSEPLIAYAMSREIKDALPQASPEDTRELRRIARKTWRYFEEFTMTQTHFLPPDSNQVDPPRGIAHRTSPTNIGLGLLAVLAARDFGYIGTGKLVELLDKTITTVEALPKWNGHLLNWYDTTTLLPLKPEYVSTVDSGNYIGYLITLRQGLLEYLNNPLVDARLVSGLEDTLACAGMQEIALAQLGDIRHAVSKQGYIDMPIWNQSLNNLLEDTRLSASADVVWRDKVRRMLEQFLEEEMLYLPGTNLLHNLPKRTTDELDVGDENDMQTMIVMLKENLALQDLPEHFKRIAGRMDRLSRKIHRGEADEHQPMSTWLSLAKPQLLVAREHASLLIHQTKALIDRLDVLIHAINFTPLYVDERKLFSIGFGLEDNKLTNSYYDLLASEARQASYIGIAMGQIPTEHWFRMGRALTIVDGYKGLVSWTGTMFEYLMPLLIMKSYPNTLLDETYSFVMKSQIKYGKQRDMPWGVSESCFNMLDRNQDYQYKAIGVPWLGLKRGLTEDTVTAPYATFLALLVNPEAAIRNIRTLQAEGLEGSHGFYEAADYTPERLPFETKRAVVKSFMSHHQGMSLLAIDDFLHHNVLQRRFHTDVEMNAAHLLLQEKIPRNLLFTKETREKALPLKGMAAKEALTVRKFSGIDAQTAKCAHSFKRELYDSDE